jgi:hypothetical protein
LTAIVSCLGRKRNLMAEHILDTLAQRLAEAADFPISLPCRATPFCRCLHHPSRAVS